MADLKELALSAVLVLCPDGTHASEAVTMFAETAGVDPSLAAALAWRESQCNKDDVNTVTGAAGMFQVMPATGAELLFGKRAKKRKLSVQVLTDPMVNAWLGGRVLKRALERCKGDVAGALSIYNGRGKCEASSFSDDVLNAQRKITDRV